MMKEFENSFFKDGPWIHLNNAGLSPISLPAKLRAEYWAKKFFEEGFASDAEYMKEAFQTKVSLANLIKCEAEEICFFTSTAGGVNQIAFSFPLEVGDEILMWDQDYSSLMYPFIYAAKKTGASLKFIESSQDLATPTEKFLSQIHDRTRMIAISWVQFQTGSIVDIAAIMSEAKKRNIFVLVDVMQGLGLMPFDLWGLGVDAVVGGSHKWLVSPVGIGFMALRKEWISRLSPLQYGSGTFGTCDDPTNLDCQPKTDASKFEPGSRQILEITALGASLDLIHKTGVENINKKVRKLADTLIDAALSAHYHVQMPNPKPEGAIVNLVSSKEKLDKLANRLREEKILFALRGGGIRLSPHAHNTEEEIRKVCELL